MHADPFGRAIRDHYLGIREEPLVDRDGDETREHKIEEYYFGNFAPNDWLESWVDSPLLDMGAGVGRDTLHFQEQFETVAIEISEHLVRTMQDRGVEDARRVDMFSLRDHFERDRFGSAYAFGTQVQLAGSLPRFQRFLSDVAHVTTSDATVVLHGYAPELDRTAEIFAYRADPAPGLAYRIFHCEYEGDVGRTLLFRLFSLDRLREAIVGSSWELAESSYGHPGSDDDAYTWIAVLTKR